MKKPVYTRLFLYDKTTKKIMSSVMLPVADVEAYTDKLEESLRAVNVGTQHISTRGMEFADRENPHVNNIRKREGT